MFFCWHSSIHARGDEFEHPLEFCVEAMQVESDAVKIEVVCRPLGPTPALLCTLHDTVQIFAFTAKPIS
jgi:hypothetical protein